MCLLLWICSHRKWGSSTPTGVPFALSSLVFQRKNICFVYQWPRSFLSQHPRHGSTEQSLGLLKIKGCSIGDSTLQLGLKRKIQVAGGSHSHIGQGPAQGSPLSGSGQHAVKFCFPEVRPPYPEQCPGWIQMEGCKDHHAAKFPLRETNQTGPLQSQHRHAKTETHS